MAACPKAPTCLFFSPLSPFWVPEEAPCCCTAATVTRGLAGACFGGRPQRKPRAQSSALCSSEAACRGGGWRGAFWGVQPSEAACGGLELVAGSILVVSPLPGISGGFGFVVLFLPSCWQQWRCLTWSNDRTRSSPET